MIRRLALTAGFAILGAVAFAPNAQAQDATQDVIFNGTIADICTFSSVTNGTLEQANRQDQWLESNQIFLGEDGTSGSATLNCSQAASLTTSAPVQNEAPAGFNSTTETAVARVGTNFTSASSNGAFDDGSWSRSEAPIAIEADTPTEIEVGMIAGNAAKEGPAIPAGDYQFTVTLTASPN